MTDEDDLSDLEPAPPPTEDDLADLEPAPPPEEEAAAPAAPQVSAQTVAPPTPLPESSNPMPSWLDRFGKWVDSNADKEAARTVARAIGAEPDQITARTRGVLDYLTAGHMDEAVGALESIAPARLSLPISQVFDPSVPTPPKRTYREAQQAQEAINKATADAAPLDYHGAGMGASMMAPGPRFGGGVGGALLSGGLSGLIGGAGNSDARLTEGQFGKYAMDAAAGGGMGALASGALHQAGQRIPGMVRGAADWLGDKVAPRMAMRSMGGTGADFTYLTAEDGLGKVDQYGRELLDAGVVRPFSGLESTFNRVGPLRREAGQAMGDDLAVGDASGRAFDLESFLRRVEDEVIAPKAKSPGVSSEVRALQGKVDEFRDLYPEGATDFVNANTLKSDFAQGQVNWGNHWNNVGPSQFLEQGRRRLVGIFNDEIEGQLEDVAGPVIRESFEANKDRYGALKWAERITGRGLGKEVGNGPVSLKDMQAAQLAQSLGGEKSTMGALASAAGAAAFNFARRRGASALAVGADAVSSSDMLQRIATTNPQALGEFGTRLAEAAARGPEAFAMQDWLLGQSDPAYMQLRREALMRANGESP